MILHRDRELCVHTCALTERGWERSGCSCSVRSGGDEVSAFPRNLSQLMFLFHFQIVFLHNDRYIEFHSQSGFYYKTRIPKFGRDFSYHYPSCDLYFVGARYWVWAFVFSFPPLKQLLLKSRRGIKRGVRHDPCLSVAQRVQFQSSCSLRNYTFDFY